MIEVLVLLHAVLTAWSWGRLYHNGILLGYTTHYAGVRFCLLIKIREFYCGTLMSLILGARIDNSSWRAPGMGLSGPGFKFWFGLPSVYPFHSMHWVVSDQLLFFLAGETPTRGQWINLKFVCSNVIAFQGGRNVRLRWFTIIGDVLVEKFFILIWGRGGHELSPCNEVGEDIVVSLWVTVCMFERDGTKYITLRSVQKLIKLVSSDYNPCFYAGENYNQHQIIKAVVRIRGVVN